MSKVKKSFTIDPKDVETLSELAEIDGSTSSYILRKIIQSHRLMLAAGINPIDIKTTKALITNYHKYKESN